MDVIGGEQPPDALVGKRLVRFIPRAGIVDVMSHNHDSGRAAALLTNLLIPFLLCSRFDYFPANP
jgi:hypothetical protein